MATSPSVPTVAIIGGGFTGAAVAYHLAKRAASPLQILIFDPRPDIGSGLAYSTVDPSHRINVPAGRMTLEPEDERHFVRWLEADGEIRGDCSATLTDGRCFPARRLFGRYVTQNLAPLLDTGQIVHHRACVASITPTNGRWRIGTTNGFESAADIVVIATSHPPPVPPPTLSDSLGGHHKFISDPWALDALDAVAIRDRVLVVGTGLTMADVIASLDGKGHVGDITAISRRGQRSRSHAAKPVEPYGDFLNPPSRTALDLLRRVRDAVKKGGPWQGLFDRLRTQGQDIWTALPLPEQRRLIRHLRPFWDTHRFRIAPQIGALLDRRTADGTLTISAASIQAAGMKDDGFAITLRDRAGNIETRIFDAVIATTGPGHSRILDGQPFLAGLVKEGLVISDPTGLGLAVDTNSRLLGVHGANRSIFVAGPLARGRFGELMGLPEVTNHAVFVTENIISLLGEYHSNHGTYIYNKVNMA